ncbi:MAG: monovalent cation/H+ antiporter complex subunit F [Myxococcota bacterium]|jgi:multicomponent Na+:H+ antiporter subunit F|nr:monovalent cation/H+ antiporter complex subunit F [Myxococcota bacterium]
MLELAAWVVATAAVAAILIAMLRLVLGPTQADRVVALDIAFSGNIALMAAAAMLSGRELFLDIAVGLALVAFVATIVWARLIDSAGKGELGRPKEDA